MFLSSNQQQIANETTSRMAKIISEISKKNIVRGTRSRRSVNLAERNLITKPSKTQLKKLAKIKVAGEISVDNIVRGKRSRRSV